MSNVNQNYLSRLEKDIASFFEYDAQRGVYTGMIGLNLAVLWTTIEDFSESFEERTEAFFLLFKELLRRGHLKLQRDGEIIEHSPEEWEKIFRGVWPEYEIEPNPLPGYAPLDMGMWFVTDDCPAYAVWVDPDGGSYYWA